MAEQEIIDRIRRRFALLSLGKPLHHRNLTLFPILGENGHEPLYRLLQEAIEEKSAFVSEVSEGGSVPTLKLENRGAMPLLIPEGEILVGAKQNRVVNITVIVAAGANFTLPVSCVEQGRWRSVSRHFQSAYYAPPRLRADKVRSVQRQPGETRSDQGEVWGNVKAALCDLKVNSCTSSLTDAFEARRDLLAEYGEKMPLPEEAIGVLAAAGERVIGMDLFDCPQTFRKLWPRLSQAYFLEAARDSGEQKEAPVHAAEEFLIRVPLHLALSPRQAGVGSALDISGGDLVGNAVWFADRLCHLAAFSAAPDRRDPR